jgi:hypothetical protein
MKRDRGFVSMCVSGARTGLAALVLLGLGQSATAAELEAQATPEQTVAVTGGLVVLTLSANAELQTRWGPVIGLGVGMRRGPAFNAYAGETVPLGSGWALRPGFRFVRSWQTVEGCPTGCTFDFYLGEIALRYRGPSGFLFEYAMPLGGWLPVGPDAGETQPHLKFYTIATGELAIASTLLFGFTFDL